jgi:hypothetical protein
VRRRGRSLGTTQTPAPATAGLLRWLVQANRDLRGCAFLLHDHVILRPVDDRLGSRASRGLCDHETGGSARTNRTAEVRTVLRTLRIGALAKEVVVESF